MIKAAESQRTSELVSKAAQDRVFTEKINPSSAVGVTSSATASQMPVVAKMAANKILSHRTLPPTARDLQTRF